MKHLLIIFLFQTISYFPEKIILLITFEFGMGNCEHILLHFCIEDHLPYDTIFLLLNTFLKGVGDIFF